MKLPRWLRWRTHQELEQEIQSHLEIEIQANLDRGLSAEDARYAALRRFGNRTRLEERAREGDPFFSLETFARDVLHGIRNLRRNPGFTLLAYWAPAVLVMLAALRLTQAHRIIQGKPLYFKVRRRSAPPR